MSRRAQVEAARAALTRRRAAAQARLDAARARPTPPSPLDARRRARRRRRLAIAAGVLLLLLLLRACPDPPPDAPPPVRGATAEAMGDPPPATAPAAAPAPPPLARQPRPAYVAEPPRPPTWLDALQLQVTARSTRLSACFEGAAAPGLLEWAATVDPRLGTTSEATLTPLATSDSVRPGDQACALEVLAHPPYRLSAPDEPPARVRLVLEF